MWKSQAAAAALDEDSQNDEHQHARNREADDETLADGVPTDLQARASCVVAPRESDACRDSLRSQRQKGVSRGQELYAKSKHVLRHKSGRGIRKVATISAAMIA